MIGQLLRDVADSICEGVAVPLDVIQAKCYLARLHLPNKFGRGEALAFASLLLKDVLLVTEVAHESLDFVFIDL